MDMSRLLDSWNPAFEYEHDASTISYESRANSLIFCSNIYAFIECFSPEFLLKMLYSR
jgi:hypothetical protein